MWNTAHELMLKGEIEPVELIDGTHAARILHDHGIIVLDE